jgi:hypothetical protein
MDSSVEKIIEDVNIGMKNNMENLLSPIVEKLKASRERDMVIFNVLQKMPEYINLLEENKKLRKLLSEKSNNEIKMDIIEKCNIGKTYSSDDLKESFQMNSEFKNIKKNVEEKNYNYKDKYIALEEKLIRWDAKFSSFFERVSLSNPLYNEIFKLKEDYNIIFNQNEKKIYEQENNVWREIPDIESWESKLTKNNNFISDSEDSDDSGNSDDSGDSKENEISEDIKIIKVETVDDRLTRQTAESILNKKINFIDCKGGEEDEEENQDEVDEEEKEDEEENNNEEEEEDEEENNNEEEKEDEEENNNEEEKEDEEENNNEEENQEKVDEEDNEEENDQEENEEDEEEELSSDEENIDKDLLESLNSEDEGEEEFLVVDINSPEGEVKEYLTTNEQSGYIYNILDDDEVGERVGQFKLGKAVFFN